MTSEAIPEARATSRVPAIAVGATLPALRPQALTRTTLALFAEASGDQNPMHIDPDVARSAGFEDVFAHGMLSMAYLGRLLTGWVPQAAIRSWSVRFAAITPLHAEPVCTGTISAIDGPLATLDVQVALADGTITVTGHAVIDVGAIKP